MATFYNLSLQQLKNLYPILLDYLQQTQNDTNIGIILSLCNHTRNPWCQGYYWIGTNQRMSLNQSITDEILHSAIHWFETPEFHSYMDYRDFISVSRKQNELTQFLQVSTLLQSIVKLQISKLRLSLAKLMIVYEIPFDLWNLLQPTQIDYYLLVEHCNDPFYMN